MADPKSKKLKADDYLQELANQTSEAWLKTLIEEILLVRGVPEESFLDKIYEELLISHGAAKRKKGARAPKRVAANKNAAAGRNNFALEALKHTKGVNALDSGATLAFHPKLTVVYGKNGSGKSGFVRILKRIAGSRTQEDIWQDVRRAKTQNNCEAEIAFGIGKKSSVYKWSGELKVRPFDTISVFDGKCIPIYLNKGLGFSYQPYGFELFPALSASLQALREKLDKDINEAENDKPEINGLLNEETSVGKFVSAIDSTTKVKDLDKLPAWDKKAQGKLKSKLKERRGLQNLEQQIELLETRTQKVRTLEDALRQAQEDLSSQNIKIYSGLIKRFNRLKSKLKTKKGETLEDYDIPEKDSEEWGGFIAAGEEYIEIAEHEEYPGDKDLCVYCRQELSKPAQKLIKLYRRLFQEEEASDLESAEEELNNAVNELENSSYADRLPYYQEDFKKLLPPKTITSSFAALEKADDIKGKISDCLTKRKVSKIQPLQVKGVIKSVEKTRIKLENEITSLHKTRRNALQKSKEVEEEIAELEDIKKFAKLRPLIEKYIKIEIWLSKTSAPEGKLNTKPITDLGKKAWEELVSGSFKKQFKAESGNLSAPEVKLDFRGEYGSQVREKSMEGLGGIDQFLSEGEQKAVALADFFAELSMQKEKAPVVFDDPANSFDHEKKGAIARRIAREAQARQVVVFTHDLVFASNLHKEVENSNGSLKPQEAAFHYLQARGNSAGIVAKDYYPGSPNFGAYMQEIDARLREAEALAGKNQMEAIVRIYDMLRDATEKAVEEKIFGKVMVRWRDQVQMRSIPNATMNHEKLNRAMELHEKFSAYITPHNQSDEMRQHALPDMEQLKNDVQEVKDLASTR